MLIKAVIKRCKILGRWSNSGILLCFYFCVLQAHASEVSLASIWKPGRGPHPVLGAGNTLSDSVHLLFPHIGLPHSLNSSHTKWNVFCLHWGGEEFLGGHWRNDFRLTAQWEGRDHVQLEFWRHELPKVLGPVLQVKEQILLQGECGRRYFFFLKIVSTNSGEYHKNSYVPWSLGSLVDTAWAVTTACAHGCVMFPPSILDDLTALFSSVYWG